MDVSRRTLIKLGALAGASMLSTSAFAGCSPNGSDKGSENASQSQASAKIDFSQLEAGTLKVGAAWSYIKLDDYLPLEEKNTQAGGASYEHAEGYYSNVKEGQELRFNIVLIDFNNDKFAVYSLEHVNPSNIDETKALIKDLTGVEPENQWYHCPHVLSAPHQIPFEAVKLSVTEACTSALSNKRPAKVGFGEGVTYANTNRCHETADGWNQVSNDLGNTDHVLPVLRFDDESGFPIAVLYTVNMASGTLENLMNSELDPIARQVSCDIAGLSERMVEEYFGGDCVAVYFAGCTGDQWGAVRAEYNYVSGPKDNLQYNKGFFDNEASWLLLEVASRRLALAVADTADRITCDNAHVITMKNEKHEFEMLDKDKLQSGPDPKQFVYEQNQETPTKLSDVSIFTIDDIAFTGVKPEMNIQSLKDIRNGSPYTHNIMQCWVSFDENSIQGYLPDQNGFDQCGKQASKTSFMPGSAEKMVDIAINMLQESYTA